jgi:hypothetical protein
METNTAAGSSLYTDVRAFIDCLDLECRALLSEDMNALGNCLEQKRHVLERLNAQINWTQPGMTRDGTRLTPQLLAMLRLAMDRNQRNASVLTPRQIFNRNRVQFLHGVMRGNNDLYQQNGLMRTATYV